MQERGRKVNRVQMREFYSNALPHFQTTQPRSEGIEGRIPAGINSHQWASPLPGTKNVNPQVDILSQGKGE